MRCLDIGVLEKLPDWIEKTVKDICHGCGGIVEVTYKPVAPPVFNDPVLTEIMEEAAGNCLGKEHVIKLLKPSLGAEDFAELLRDVPGSMLRLGVMGLSGCAPLHNCKFNPDERAIAIGVEVLAATLITWIKKSQNQ